MSHALTLEPAATPCGLHPTHDPQPWTTEMHHVVLESWTDHLKVPHSRLVPLCPGGHDAVHVAIRLTLEGKPMPYPVSPEMQALVDEAVAFWHANPGLPVGIEEPHTHG